MNVEQIKDDVTEHLRTLGCACEVEVDVYMKEVDIDDEGNSAVAGYIAAEHEEWCPLVIHGPGGNN